MRGCRSSSHQCRRDGFRRPAQEPAPAFLVGVGRSRFPPACDRSGVLDPATLRLLPCQAKSFRATRGQMLLLRTHPLVVDRHTETRSPSRRGRERAESGNLQRHRHPSPLQPLQQGGCFLHLGKRLGRRKGLLRMGRCGIRIA